VILLLLLGGNFIFNLASFSSINSADLWSLKRLSSNELIELYQASSAPLRTEWIYPVIEDLYGGSTLYIPADMLDSLDFSVELLKIRGHLSEVVPSEIDGELTEGEVELIQAMEYSDLKTKDGKTYHFIIGRKGSSAPLLLLYYDNQLFFIPEDLHQEIEGSL
jgi:hypothetical protein